MVVFVIILPSKWHYIRLFVVAAALAWSAAQLEGLMVWCCDCCVVFLCSRSRVWKGSTKVYCVAMTKFIWKHDFYQFTILEIMIVRSFGLRRKQKVLHAAMECLGWGSALNDMTCREASLSLAFWGVALCDLHALNISSTSLTAAPLTVASLLTSSEISTTT